MSDMKCPICGSKMSVSYGNGEELFSCSNVACRAGYFFATDGMWQELIRTQKALDLALDALETIGGYLDYNDCVGVALNATDKIYEALEQIKGDNNE